MTPKQIQNMYWDIGKFIEGVYKYDYIHYDYSYRSTYQNSFEISELQFIQHIKKHYKKEIDGIEDYIFKNTNNYLSLACIVKEAFIIIGEEKAYNTIVDLKILKSYLRYCKETIKASFDQITHHKKYNHWHSGRDASEEYTNYQDYLLSFNQKNMSTSLVDFVQNKELEDIDKILVDKGAMDSDKKPTESGKELLLYVLFKEHKAELASLLSEKK